MFGRTGKLAAMVAVLLPLTACEDGIGVGARGTVDVTLSQSASAAAARAVGEAAFEESAGKIDLSAIESIELDVTGVDLHRSGTAEDSTGGWVSLDVVAEGGATVDLLEVPSETTVGIDLARGEVVAGDYRKLRIRFSGARIVFAQTTQVGPASFDAGTEYELVIPSGTQSGLKTDIAVTIEEGETDTVQLVFAGSASAASINATGNGKVMMAPVLRTK